MPADPPLVAYARRKVAREPPFRRNFFGEAGRPRGSRAAYRCCEAASDGVPLPSEAKPERGASKTAPPRVALLRFLVPRWGFRRPSQLPAGSQVG